MTNIELTAKLEKRKRPYTQWARTAGTIMEYLGSNRPAMKETMDEIFHQPELLLAPLQTWDATIHLINDSMVTIEPDILKHQGMNHTEALTRFCRQTPDAKLPCLLPTDPKEQQKLLGALWDGVNLTGFQMLNGDKDPIPPEFMSIGLWTRSHKASDPNFRREGVIGHLVENTIRQIPPFSTLKPDLIIDSMLEVLGAYFRSTETFKILHSNNWYDGIGERYSDQLRIAISRN